MRTEAKPPRGKALWIVLALVAVLIAGGLVSVSVLNQPASPGGPGASGPASETSAPSASGSATNPPEGHSDGTNYETANGCLGGSGSDAKALLTAQELAGHNEQAAVEFAAAMVRFIYRYPYPSDEDAQAATERALAKAAEPDDLVQFYAGKPNLSGGVVTDSTPWRMSTMGGVYYVESASSDTVEVSIGTRYVVDGALSPNLITALTVTVVYEDGRWKFLDSSASSTANDVFGVGQPFSEGC